MFGLKKFKETKTKKFESDKKRKQYFAIRNYYKAKSVNSKNKNDNKK